MRQYEIWWAQLPKPVGRRPVLLLTRTPAYAYLSKYVVAEITTTVRRIAVEVPLGKTEGLPRRCAANFDNLRTVPCSTLVRKAGSLAPLRRVEVKRALGHAFGWTELAEL